MYSKKILTLAVTASTLFMASCGNTQTSTTAEEGETECLLASAISVDSLLTIAEGFVGDTVVARGTVRHTCKHSGRKCFISNKTRTTQMQVLAGGKIGGFNKELIGSDIAVKGVLREHRITRDDLNKAEQEVEALRAQGSASNAETCETAMGDISAKRAYMDLNNKDYYSEFYLDGLDYMECPAQ